MANHSARYLATHFDLLLRVTRSDLAARYAGSLLGIGWTLAAPLAILGIYAVVYLYIFAVRPAQMSPLDYVLYMYAGLVPFLMTGESLAGGVTSVLANRSVLNNTVFPIDLAPVKPVLASQGISFVGFSVILLLSLVTGALAWTVLLLPCVWILQILFLVGLNWVLSLINVVFRDLQYFIGILLMVMLIASPIAYTPEMVPHALKAILFLNPFAYFVIVYQQILVLGTFPPIGEWTALILLSGGMFIFGGWIFSKGKQVLVDYV